MRNEIISLYVDEEWGCYFFAPAKIDDIASVLFDELIYN